MAMETVDFSRAKFVRSRGNSRSYKLIGQSISDSTAITGATETQTNFDNKITLPANFLKIGNRIRLCGAVKHTATTGAETHDILVVCGSTTLLSVATIDPANDNILEFVVEFQITAVGASGVVRGFAQYRATAAGGTATAWVDKAIDAVTLDTTAVNELAVAIDRQATATDADSAKCIRFFAEMM